MSHERALVAQCGAQAAIAVVPSTYHHISWCSCFQADLINGLMLQRDLGSLWSIVTGVLLGRCPWSAGSSQDPLARLHNRAADQPAPTA